MSYYPDWRSWIPRIPLPWPQPSPAPVPPVTPPPSPVPSPVLVPAAGMLPVQNLASWTNWRAFLYGFTPIAVTALTAINLQFQDRISVWIMLALAIIGPLLSTYNSTDKMRRIVYGVLGILSTAGYAATLFVGHEAWLPVVSSVVAIVSSTLSRYYTPTTTYVTALSG